MPCGTVSTASAEHPAEVDVTTGNEWAPQGRQLPQKDVCGASADVPVMSLQLTKAGRCAERGGEAVGSGVCKLPEDVQRDKGTSSGEASPFCFNLGAFWKMEVQLRRKRKDRNITAWVKRC